MGIIGPYREAHSGISDRWQFVVVLQVGNPAGKMTNLSMKISNIAKHTISTRNLQKKNRKSADGMSLDGDFGVSSWQVVRPQWWKSANCAMFAGVDCLLR